MSSTKVAVVTLIAIAVTVSGARPWPDLNPNEWPGLPALQRMNSFFGPHPLARSSKYGVVSGTSNVMAASAGLAALRHGGNAVDACIAGAVAQTVAAANSYVSFAGIADMLVFNASTNKTYSLLGNWGRVAANADPQPSPLGSSVLVHGFPLLMATASLRFGRLSFGSLLEPARVFAEQGTPVMLTMRYFNRTALTRSPQGRRLDEIISNQTSVNFTLPNMAALLRRLQDADRVTGDPVAVVRAEMYGVGANTSTATFAADMLLLVNNNGGNISSDDLERYEVRQNAASAFPYPLRPAAPHREDHRQKVDTLPAPVMVFTDPDGPRDSLGAVEVREQLNLMSLVSASLLTNSSAVFAIMAQIQRWTMSMTDLWICNALAPLLEIPGGVFRAEDVMNATTVLERRATSEYAVAVAPLLNDPESMNGVLLKIFGLAQEVFPDVGRVPKTPHSDAYVAADTDGNICALGHSINTGNMWGTGLFAHDIPLSDAGAGAENQLLLQRTPAEQNMVITPTRPVIVATADEGDGPRAFGAISTIGESLGPVTFQSLVAMLVPPQVPERTQSKVAAACFAPHFHFTGRHLPGQVNPIGLNIAQNCTAVPDPYTCINFNLEFSTVTPAFVEALPAWLQGSITELDGNDRIGHNGLMAVVLRNESSTDEPSFEACASPDGNGGAVGA